MGELTIFGALRNAISRKKALHPLPNRGWHRLIREPYAGAWQRNDEERAETLLCYPTLYACLSRISQDIGKLPFQLMRQLESGIWKPTENTSYSPVLRKPNHYQTAQQFRESWLLSKLQHGNTYALKGFDERGVVNRLYVLDPCRVMPMVSDSGDVFYQLNYKDSANLLPAEYPGEQIIIPARDIIHDRMNCVFHALIGVPPLCAAYWPAVKNLKILKDSTRFFTNGANPGGILTAPAGMSDDDAQAVKDYWNSNFQGENAGKVAVIGADMRFTPFAFKAADSQLVEQMRYSDEQICQPFGIPPFKIGIGSIPAGLGVDAINQLYYADALQSHIEAIENLLDEALRITKNEQGERLGVELDLEPLLRMDVGKQADVETKLTGGGVKTPNEARLRFNLPPLDGGNTVYLQQQDLPLEQARLNRSPNAAPAEPAEPGEEDEGDEEAVRAFVAHIEKSIASVLDEDALLEEVGMSPMLMLSYEERQSGL
jgi:HK97 family phage portal protein